MNDLPVLLLPQLVGFLSSGLSAWPPLHEAIVGDVAAFHSPHPAQPTFHAQLMSHQTSVFPVSGLTYWEPYNPDHNGGQQTTGENINAVSNLGSIQQVQPVLSDDRKTHCYQFRGPSTVGALRKVLTPRFLSPPPFFFALFPLHVHNNNGGTRTSPLAVTISGCCSDHGTRHSLDPGNCQISIPLSIAFQGSGF